MGVSDLLYGAYERRLMRQLDRSRLPRHVGAIVDGNRRWAKDARTDLESGYQAGADGHQGGQSGYQSEQEQYPATHGTPQNGWSNGATGADGNWSDGRR